MFGSDGRLDLHNPAFARQWRLEPDALNGGKANARTSKPCSAGAGRSTADDAFWAQLRGAVTGLERREPMTARLERLDGSVLDCATVPLPDGATLVTFQDVTDSVNVERALIERADALQEADRLKSAFVQHVSYELRSPLTNIIGFAQLLRATPSIGPLTGKQREYLGYIGASSSALLAIINDILDLATIDAGAMTLDLKAVDIRAAVDAAAEGVQDRIAEQGILLDVRAAPDIGSFMADERRVRQILFNLLSNAVELLAGGRDRAADRGAARRGGGVRDHGPRARASRTRSARRCSTASRATRSVPAIAAPGSACRSCVPSSSCMVVR